VPLTRAWPSLVRSSWQVPAVRTAAPAQCLEQPCRARLYRVLVFRLALIEPGPAESAAAAIVGAAGPAAPGIRRTWVPAPDIAGAARLWVQVLSEPGAD
jgi:hypothetical protein